MQTIEEFVRGYFARKAELFLALDSNSTPFRAKYFTADYLANCRKIFDKELARRSKETEVILSVAICPNSAEVITSERDVWDTKVIRRRYHLHVTKAGWRIDRKATECWSCKGKGRNWLDENSCCSYCKGTGWCYYGASRR